MVIDGVPVPRYNRLDYMQLSIIPIPEQTVQCGYFPDRAFTSEHFLVDTLDGEHLDVLLLRGFRHFGKYFFRPVCVDCGRCIPLRVDVGNYHTSKSARRLFRKNGDLEIRITAPAPREEAFELYKLHKTRFKEGGTESYRQFTKAFFHEFTSSKELSMYLDRRLVCLCHFDETDSALSAVYTYYNDTFADRSLGTYAVYRLIRYAKELNLDYVYLGYYIEGNRHMAYKSRFYPNEISPEEGTWVPFVTDKNEVSSYDAVTGGFTVSTRLFSVTEMPE